MARQAWSIGLSGVFVICLQSTIAAGTPGVLYVDATAPSGGDGAAWSTAFMSLQDALKAAATAGGGVTEIRLAGGVYRPDQGSSQTPGDRNATFTPVAGVSLRGGYAGGSGTNPNARDLTAYPTILSGDLDGDDDLFGDISDNCRHVVTVTRDLGTSTILDGLTIAGGYADGMPGSGDGQGAGVWVSYGSAHFTNCRILGNTGAQGGGFYVGSYAALKLTGCAVIENNASNGGGIYAGSAWNLSVDGCAFNGNSAVTGGAIYCYSSPATVTSSVFSGNSAYPLGPTIYTDLTEDITIVNCTVAAAVTDLPEATGCTLHCPNPPAPYTYGVAKISNCILWNTSTEVCGLTTSCSVEYCDVRTTLGFSGGVAIRRVLPAFVRNPNLTAWPVDYGDLHLQPTSLCVDAGNSVDPPASMKTDIDGHGRRIDDPTVPDTGTTASYSPAIDLGAHELHQWSPADFNFDHYVNQADWDHFEACALGPRIAQDYPACWNADLDLDRDVDAADFGGFQRCLSGDGLMADPFCLGDRSVQATTTSSPCLQSSLTLDEYPYCGDPQMEYMVSGPGELTVTRRNAVHNCCPDLIEAVVSQGRGLLHFEEQETTTNPCACLCCYTVETKVTGLSGTYDIEYCWVRNWDQPKTCVTATITVP